MVNPEPEASATVLVVDDNEANRALAESTLEDEGYRVVLAHDGEEGFRVFDAERPDCVVLDVRMPGTNGFTVCERIRATPHGADTPVIFLTALRDVDTFDRAIAVGSDDFLTKPVRPAELVLRVQAALKFRRMRADLAEHYGLLRDQRDALMRLQLQKERLTAFLVHDLKNPVNAMDLHAQLLLRDPSLGEGARKSASQVRAEARRLNRMILNLLDVAKGDEGKLEVHPTDVRIAALFADVFSELGPGADVRSVRLEGPSGTESVRGDEELLRRVGTNLVENAIRHAPSGTVVRVESSAVDDAVEIRVSDSGAGIPPSLRERVFDPFVQAEAGPELQSRAGRGLGLAFCKLAIEAHGGRIWIEEAAPGAVFVVKLPR